MSRSCEKIHDTAKLFRAEAQSRRGRKENKAVIYSESLRLSVSTRVLYFFHTFQTLFSPTHSFPPPFSPKVVEWASGGAFKYGDVGRMTAADIPKLPAANEGMEPTLTQRTNATIP